MVDPRGDARVRCEDGLPTGWLVGGSFDGWGCAHKVHFGLGDACRSLPLARFAPLLKRHYCMPIAALSARMIQDRAHFWLVPVLLGHVRFEP